MSILYHHVSFCRRFTSLQKLSTSSIVYINNVISSRRGNCTTASSDGINLVATKLKSRSLIKVSGIDSRLFLQGMITNDISYLETQPSIYTLFLNHQGRVLYDAILYSTEKPENTLIECDASIKSKLIKYLNVYRIRKKLEISDVDNDSSNSNELKQGIWVIFDSTLKSKITSKYLVSNNSSSDDNNNNNCTPELSHKLTNREIEQELCCGPAYNHSSKQEKLKLGNASLDVIVDPRLPELGYRVLVSHHNSSSSDGLPKDVNIKILPESEYTEFRYALGIGEGISDLPPANCFPLESNVDYLHGISFQKGCYIGQELTARTHHTGVVRKRLMPLIFSSPAPSFGNPTAIINPEHHQLHGKEGKSIGKVRGIHNVHGLALVRISEALNSQEIKLGEHLVKVPKPFWWHEHKSQSG